MNNIRSTYRILILCLLLVTLTGAGLLALTNPQIPRYTLSSSGQSSGGGTYTLSGTFGQHDASYLSTGGNYTLIGGFWGGVSGNTYSSWLYLPIVRR